jgi:hypothetical protein
LGMKRSSCVKQIRTLESVVNEQVQPATSRWSTASARPHLVALGLAARGLENTRAGCSARRAMLLAAWRADALDESHGCCFALLLGTAVGRCG